MEGRIIIAISDTANICEQEILPHGVLVDVEVIIACGTPIADGLLG
jgi:hypothetical protein